MTWEYTYKYSHGTNAEPGSLGWWLSPTSSASPSSSSWPSWSSCFHSSLLLSFFSPRRYIYIYIFHWTREGSYSQAKLARYPGRFISTKRQTSHRTTSTPFLPFFRSSRLTSPSLLVSIWFRSMHSSLFGCFALNSQSTLDRSAIRNKNGFIAWKGRRGFSSSQRHDSIRHLVHDMEIHRVWG